MKNKTCFLTAKAPGKGAFEAAAGMRGAYAGIAGAKAAVTVLRGDK